MSNKNSTNEIGRIFAKALDANNSPRSSPKVSRPSHGLCDPRKGTAFPKGSYWTREDMGFVSFTLTLMVLATVVAVQSDWPVLWLTVGLAPFVVAFGVVAFLGRRFNLCAYVPDLRDRSAQIGERSTRRRSSQCRRLLAPQESRTINSNERLQFLLPIR